MNYERYTIEAFIVHHSKPLVHTVSVLTSNERPFGAFRCKTVNRQPSTFMKKIARLGLIWLAASFFGCKDEPEQIPAYIQLEPYTVNAPGGLAWQKLPFAWVYVNTLPVGAYSPGKPFPVLAEGEADVVVFPGINANGIADTPDLYPFLVRYDTKVTLTPGQTTTIRPETRYDTDAKAPWTDRGEFDGSTLVFEDLDQDFATSIVFDTDSAYAGRSARMVVDTAHALMAVGSEWVAGLPVTGDREIWMEMHYKNDVPFELYLFGRNSFGSETSQPIYLFQSKAEWNKIYINLTPAIVESVQEEYRVVFRLPLPNDGTKFSQPRATVQLDNLRLLHF